MTDLSEDPMWRASKMRFDPTWLQNVGAIIEGNTARIKRRHIDGLTHSPDEEPKECSGSSESADTSTAEPYVVIPLHQDCKEYFEYLGWRPNVAKNLWKNYSKLPIRMRDDFCPSASAWSQDCLRDTYSESSHGTNDDWEGGLWRMGMSQSMIDAIMDPEYADVRLTASSLEWVQQTHFERTQYLERRMYYSHRFTMPILPLSESDKSNPSDETVPGATVLWRACIQENAKLMWKGGIPYQDEFKLDTMCPHVMDGYSGDFSVTHGTYWTPHRRYAQQCAGFLARRHADIGIPVCLVRIVVPNKLVEDLGAAWLEFPSPAFKEVVVRRFEDRDWLRWVTQAKVRIGPVCKSTDTPAWKLTEPEHFREERLFKIDIEGVTTVARQYYFCGDRETLGALEVACQLAVAYFSHKTPGLRLTKMV